MRHAFRKHIGCLYGGPAESQCTNKGEINGLTSRTRKKFVSVKWIMFEELFEMSQFTQPEATVNTGFISTVVSKIIKQISCLHKKTDCN